MGTDKEKKKLGRLGEDEACVFLLGMGQTVLDRNWRRGHLELDIVSLDEAGVHFVEVKTRREPMQADPQDSVNFAKQKKLTLAAMRYLREKDGGKWSELEVYFDVVSVVFAPDGVKIEHFPKAFIPVFFGA